MVAVESKSTVGEHPQSTGFCVCYGELHEPGVRGCIFYEMQPDVQAGMVSNLVKGLVHEIDSLKEELEEEKRRISYLEAGIDFWKRQYEQEACGHPRRRWHGPMGGSAFGSYELPSSCPDCDKTWPGSFQRTGDEPV